MFPAYLGMKRKSAQGTDARYSSLMCLGRDAYVSQSGMQSLMNAVKEEGLPEAYSRGTQYRARKSVCGELTPYGRLVEEVELHAAEGAPVTLAIQNPLAMLYKSASSSSGFSELLLKALAVHPSTPASPWNIILYQDGVNPSDGLAKNASRKAAAFYWSFLEFGLHALSKEEMWNTITVVREREVKRLEGHLPRITGVVLKYFFDPDGHDIERCGINLKFPDGTTTMLFAKWGILLADEPALKEVLDSKGHSGAKPCILCMNASIDKYPGGGLPLHVRSDYAVSIAVLDLSKFKLHSDETLQDAMRRLRDHSLTSQLKEMEMVYGLNYSKHNLLLNTRLNVKAVSILMYDWAHCYLCDGLADVEFGMFMKQMHAARTRTSYAELSTYVAGWTQPKGLPGVAHCLSTRASKNNIRNSNFSSTASEFLTLAPMLLLYLTRVCLPREECMAHVQSMIAVLIVLEYLQAVKRGIVSPEQLRIAIQTHLDLFSSVYADAKRPKHHYVLHLPTILDRHGVILTTLTQERKHKMVRRYTVNRKNLRSWELGTMEEITCHALRDLHRVFATSALFKGHLPSPKLCAALREAFPNTAASDLQVSQAAIGNDGIIYVGDVILLDYQRSIVVGKSLLNVAAGNDVYVVVSLWRNAPDASLDPRVSSYDVQDSVAVVPIAAVHRAVPYRMSDDGQVCAVYNNLEYRR